MKKAAGYITQKSGDIISSLAIVIGAISVNSTCMMWYHQPKVPEGMNKFKKMAKS